MPCQKAISRQNPQLGDNCVYESFLEIQWNDTVINFDVDYNPKKLIQD